jgi:ribosomal protein S27E
MRVTTECPHCGKNTRIDLSAETTTQKCHHCGERLSSVPTGWERIKKKRTHFDDDTNWSDHASTTRAGISPLLWTTLALTILGLASAFAYYAMKNRGSSSTNNPLLQTNTQAVSTESTEASHYDYIKSQMPAATTLANEALNATSLDEWRRYLHDPDHLTTERLQKYHRSSAPFPLPLGIKKVLPINNTRYLPAEKIITLSYIDAKDQTQALPLREQADGSLKIDWPSFVAENPQPLSDYARSQSTEPQIFRVTLRRDSYYNFDFNDEQKHYCFRLEDPHTKDVIYGYYPKSTTDNETALPYLRMTQLHRVMVKIRLPQPSRSKDQVEIVEFIQNKWLMP